MQYLLTQKEYDKILEQASFKEGVNKKVIQKLCTEVANHKPVYKDYEGKIVPWGCVLNEPADPINGKVYCIEYCDECPVQEVCPNEYKHWSK